MFHHFLPKDGNFFDLFDKQAGYAVDAARLFRQLTEKGNIDDNDIEKMQSIEHQSDDVAHSIIDRLNKTFVTPFDREDIHALTKELDDITDMINTIVSRMKIYKLTKVDQNLVDFSSVIEKSVAQVFRAVKGLRSIKNYQIITEACVEINSFENIGDTMRDKVLAQLFENQKDAVTIIKLKEIYQDAETTLDICEDVAHVVSSILVKQA